MSDITSEPKARPSYPDDKPQAMTAENVDLSANLEAKYVLHPNPHHHQPQLLTLSPLGSEIPLRASPTTSS